MTAFRILYPLDEREVIYWGISASPCEKQFAIESTISTATPT